MNTSGFSEPSIASMRFSPGEFRATVNHQPLVVRSVLAGSTLRPELGTRPNHWIWKVIADGKVGGKRVSIGLFFDRDLLPGTYDIVGNSRINFVYNRTPHFKSLIYHSAHFQDGHLTLLEVDRCAPRLRGEFSFSISAINFSVTDGAFDLDCKTF
ncbi:hypothetical protein AUC61_10430 [Pseudomonas sp. S25]|uniref:Uncharacterized protein n=1 Tax=Pseudomonas maioricensis TaxID=1766623 RepID=A0ABS9ZH61_9PSED|nr:hypothetical protein [Pseudomonas sp. S25]MCI8209949.1 hypothetical protein [Pseudomonas sp. S25]